jgi:hypothetical protein
MSKKTTVHCVVLEKVVQCKLCSRLIFCVAQLHNSLEESSPKRAAHSDYRAVSPYWVLPVYVELIRAVWADDGDRPLLF